jgi:hypothetical protein
MTTNEKIAAILHMNGNDGSDLHFRLQDFGHRGIILSGFNDGSTCNRVIHFQVNGVDESEDFCTFDRLFDESVHNRKAVDDLFNYYAHLEYQKKKLEFAT